MGEKVPIGMRLGIVRPSVVGERSRGQVKIGSTRRSFWTAGMEEVTGRLKRCASHRKMGPVFRVGVSSLPNLAAAWTLLEKGMGSFLPASPQASHSGRPHPPKAPSLTCLGPFLDCCFLLPGRRPG